MGGQAGNRTCEGMQGLLQEGEKPVREMKKSPVLAMAEMLGQADAAEILQETLDDEKATDERLSEIAEAIMTGDEMEEEAEEEPEEEEITSE